MTAVLVGFAFLVVRPEGGRAAGLEPAELSVAAFGAELELANIKAHLDAFEKANPGISAELTIIKYNQYPGWLAEHAESDSIPDIVYVDTSYLPSLQHGLLDIGGLIDEDQTLVPDSFYPRLWESAHVDGVLKALPAFHVEQVIYYNRDMFEKAGVPPPRANWTWDDFVRTAKQLTVRNADGMEQYGYLCRADQYAEVSTWVQQAGVRWGRNMYYDPHRIEETLDALRFMAELVHRHRISPDYKALRALLKEHRKHRYWFANGPFAMVKTGTYELMNFRNGGLPFDWDMAELPRHRRKANRLSVFALGIGRTTRYPVQAYALAKFIIQRPARGAPAMVDSTVWDRYITFYGLENKNTAVFEKALAYGVQDEPAHRVLRENSRVRYGPLGLTHGKWSAESAERYKKMLADYLEMKKEHTAK